jgi:hypothetical protein
MSTPATPLNITYVDPDGSPWNLSDLSMANGYVCSGYSGIEGLATMMQTVPLLDGTAVPQIYIPQPGSIILSILVSRPDTPGENAYYSLLDGIARAFLTRRNELPAPGTLIVQRPDGTSRQISVFTTSGINTPEVAIDYTIYTFTLQTPDPYWSDLASQSLVYSLVTVPGILPVLPVALGSSTVIGMTNVANGGNALAWPVWTITGPGTPTITNNTTGRHWSLNTPVPSGHVVQVTTKPGTQMAVDQTIAANIWDQLVLSSLRDLWPLVGGVNNINIAMAGSTGATSVMLSWTNRWNRA